MRACKVLLNGGSLRLIAIATLSIVLHYYFDEHIKLDSRSVKRAIRSTCMVDIQMRVIMKALGVWLRHVRAKPAAPRIYPRNELIRALRQIVLSSS